MHTSLRELITNFDWSLKSIVKAAVALVVIVIALSITLSILGTVARNVFGFDTNRDGYYYDDSSRGIVAQFVGNLGDSMGFDSGLNTKAVSMGRGGAATEDMALMMESSIAPMAYNENGADAEEYERREYSGYYETRRFEETCSAVSDLKPLEYVVFDNSNKNEDWCYYTFRVEVSHEDEVIEKLQALNPRDFYITTSSVERSIEYSDSELAMQQRRLESTQKTLDQAEAAFNNLIAQATREGDTSTLSEIINNKISTIDRLTQQLLNTQERIDRLSKGRGEQIEQIEYAHFSVSVSRVTFFDGQQFVDEWKHRIQQLVNDINGTILALTVGLIAFALSALQLIVFGALTILGLTFFVKIMWTIVKRIWKWEKTTPRTNSYEA